MSKDYLGIIIILICLFFLVSQNTYSSSKEEDYKLQEQCGKRSEEYFKKEYNNGFSTYENIQITSHYQNHYNKKLNKCFILMETTYYNTYTKKNDSFIKDINDINENKKYGSFSRIQIDYSPITCEVSGKTCKSEEEWDKLVKPYMEE